MMTKKSPKVANNFSCEKCHYICSKQSDLKKHLLTRKHLNDDAELHKNRQNEYICNCGKTYKFRQGLNVHKKRCKYNSDTDNNTNKQLIELLIKENSDFKNIVLEVVKSNTELQKQLVDVCKNTSTNINNSHNTQNSHNKTFNLQFFLNEQCKDAMNMSDFVNTFELQLSDLESVGDLGYVEGISKIIVERLNSLDIYKRPMHCSDAKREILYIKDADKWEKEERHNPKLRKAIQTVSFKNMKLVTTWSDTYPESKNSESRLNDRYMKLIKQSTGGNGESADNEDKIIRRIAKEIVIDK